MNIKERMNNKVINLIIIVSVISLLIILRLCGISRFEWSMQKYMWARNDISEQLVVSDDFDEGIIKVLTNDMTGKKIKEMETAINKMQKVASEEDMELLKAIEMEHKKFMLAVNVAKNKSHDLYVPDTDELSALLYLQLLKERTN